MKFPRERFCLVVGILFLLLSGVFESYFKVLLIPLYINSKLVISYELLLIWLLYEIFYNKPPVIGIFKRNRKKLKRIAVFIDSSNIYGIVKDHLNLKNSNLKIKKGVYKGNVPQDRIEINTQKKIFSLFDFIEDVINERYCVFKGYYLGEIIYNGNMPPVISNIKLSQKQDKSRIGALIERGFTIRKGRVETFYSKGSVSQKEKGVDITMALDIYQGALFNSYDIAVIISSDNDFYPVFEKIKLLGKEVEYISLGKNESNLLQSLANYTRVVNYKDYIK